ncbi:MAG: resolvase [Candidatus Cloacimonetes bacterium]|nr:resolvase [Candidatus Cloacimonadota bacterium]
MRKKSFILAIDPGNSKWGVAIVDSDLIVHEQGIFVLDLLYTKVSEFTKKYEIDHIVLGNQTKSSHFLKVLSPIEIPIHLIDEKGSTLEAKDLYFELYPPSGIKKLIPRGLLYPPRDFDDVTAIILAQRFFAN